MEDLKFKTANDVMNWSNNDKDCAFQSNRNSGFQMDVNGFRISIQFGPGNYIQDSDIRYRTDQDAPTTFNHWGTDTAEVLIWERNDAPIEWGAGDTVIGWVKTKLGADAVAAVEKSLEDQIALINTPVTATGKPW